ncbi:MULTISPECIES: ATP-dependent 6-phosphofructokinase [unclassified Dietzia]|uniref:ATP-dependent 6-phosphofructokinase n=1 Tax=unclassified Dietzia TaxID=2617939 RepID=UPI000D21A29F|nr:MULTISPECIES: ATP-dependent 6-phosphofructokinase [unclassified Dietzia]AVZ39669.1 6-phosphofructokinase [Dietzia sp. JS16-p6b]MBB1023518.1 6-phosphofructokinase [Dietzia sp. DQ12-76]MBB1026132.1 6-phosphofructokinase [Dietzia sp. DQ11-38-2]QGW24982.1 6-phosphofructokinase [Dietzia sp. DQ12-45-1b]
MRIGVLTAGGDCPGLNAVIRALVRTANSEYDSPVLGFQDGWAGLVHDRAVPLFDDEGIDRILLRGGTILGTGRLNPDILTASLPQIRRTLARHSLDALVAIGGDGTLRAARWLTENGIPVVGVPKTIDNDVAGTDYTFGFDTAVSIASDAIDRLHTTAESHERVMLVEVMGRHAGWIALHSGLASGAHMIVIPEVPFDIDYVCKVMKRRFQMGEAYGICVVAEGATPAEGSGMTLRSGGTDQFGHRVFTGVADQMASAIAERMNRDVRTTVLGHIQRGGTPTAYDRVLATRYGVHAAHAAHRGDFGQVVALRGESIEMVPVAEAVAVLKTVPEDRYREAACLFG